MPMRPSSNLTLLSLTAWVLLSGCFPAQAQYAANCGVHSSAIQLLESSRQPLCQTVRDSQMCQDLYQKIRDDGGDADSKALKCDKIPSALTRPADWTIGCALGIYDSTVGLVVDLASGAKNLAVAAGRAWTTNRERLRRCDGDLNLKKGLFKIYNESTPRILQITPPSDERLGKISCAQLEADLYRARERKNQFALRNVEYKAYQKNPKLSPEEKEYLDWKAQRSAVTPGAASDLGLVNLAQRQLNELGVRLECYNSEASSRLMCEALFIAATGTVGASKLALSKLSGLKVERFMVSIGDRAGGNLAALNQRLKALSDAEKTAYLARATKLTPAERIKASQTLLGRSLTQGESDALIKAHNLPMNDLTQKARVLKDAGFTPTEREAIMRTGITGEFDGFIRAATEGVRMEQAQYARVRLLEKDAMKHEQKLMDTNLPPEQRLTIEKQLDGTYDKIARERSTLLGDVIGPGAGPVDLQRIERHIGKATMELEVSLAAGGRPQMHYATRSKALQELGEFNAMASNFDEAVSAYRLAADDVSKAVAADHYKSTGEKLVALRTLAQTPEGRSSEAYQKLVGDLSSKVQSPSQIEFPPPSVNPAVLKEQRGQIWEKAREIKELSVRIDIEEVRNTKLLGASYVSNPTSRSAQNLEKMMDRRGDLTSELEKMILKKYPSPSQANKVKQLLLDQ